MKAILPLFLAFAIVAIFFTVSVAPPVNTPAYAGKMNGKPGGGRNSAHYDQPASKPTGTATKSKKGQ